MNETLLHSLDETCINEFRPGYVEALIQHFTEEFDWDGEFARLVLRDAIRVLALSSLTPNGEEPNTTKIAIPPPIVDQVIDAIFLDSPLLKWLEDNVFGVRLLHVPNYAHGESDQLLIAARYQFTRALMRSARYELDNDIWPEAHGSRPCSVGGGWNDCLVFRAI
jgi:hypothetical protein